MFFEEWLNLDNDRKAVYFLGLSEKAFLRLIASPYSNFIRESLDICWDWLNQRKPSASDFYHYLDDDDNKNSLGLLSQFEHNNSLLPAWNCIITAVAFTLYIASEYHHEILPQPADCSDYDEVLNDFHNNFRSLFGEELMRDIEGKMLSLLEGGDAKVFDKKYVITSLGITQ